MAMLEDVMAQLRNKVLRNLISNRKGSSSASNGPASDLLPGARVEIYTAETLPTHLANIKSDLRLTKLPDGSYKGSICRHLDIGHYSVRATALSGGQYYEVVISKILESRKMKLALLILRQIARDAIYIPTYSPTHKREEEVEMARKQLHDIAEDIGYYPAKRTCYPSVITNSQYTFGKFEFPRVNETIDLWGVTPMHYKSLMNLMDILREAFNPGVTRAPRMGRPPKSGMGESLDSGHYNINLVAIFQARDHLHRLYDIMKIAQKGLCLHRATQPVGLNRVRRLTDQQCQIWRKGVLKSFGRPKKALGIILSLNSSLRQLIFKIGNDSLILLSKGYYDRKPPFTENGWKPFFNRHFPHIIKAVGLKGYKPSAIKSILNKWTRDSETRHKEIFGRPGNKSERW